MSNGSLAQLPPDNIPEGLKLPDSPSVMLLLPRNKYLLGTETFSKTPKWVYCPENQKITDVNLYDGENLCLPASSENLSEQIILSSKTVNELNRELYSQMEPPGEHFSTVLILQSILKSSNYVSGQALTREFARADEREFMSMLGENPLLFKIYWAVRFAMVRNEMEHVVQIERWTKFHDVFEDYLAQNHDGDFENDSGFRIWFSILEMPDEKIMREINELEFSRDDIERALNQKVSPVRIYNPNSGWLVLARFGFDEAGAFFMWQYVKFDLWKKFESRRANIQDMILALWGAYEVDQAVRERLKYKKGEDVS